MILVKYLIFNCYPYSHNEGTNISQNCSKKKEEREERRETEKRDILTRKGKVQAD